MEYTSKFWKLYSPPTQALQKLLTSITVVIIMYLYSVRTDGDKLQQ